MGTEVETFSVCADILEIVDDCKLVVVILDWSQDPPANLCEEVELRVPKNSPGFLSEL